MSSALDVILWLFDTKELYLVFPCLGLDIYISLELVSKCEKSNREPIGCAGSWFYVGYHCVFFVMSFTEIFNIGSNTPKIQPILKSSNECHYILWYICCSTTKQLICVLLLVMNSRFLKFGINSMKIDVSLLKRIWNSFWT